MTKPIADEARGGYIARDPDGNAIHGTGATAKDAVRDACEAAQDPSAAEWLVTRPATARLLAQVRRQGGAIAWTEADGVADVRDE